MDNSAVESLAGVGGGDYGVDTGNVARRCRIDAEDARVGMRAVQRFAPESAGERDVGGVAGAARDFVDAVNAGRGFTEDSIRNRGEPPGLLRS